MSDYELYHYGVKGMKWGIRRTAAQLGHVVKKGARKAKDAIDAKRAEKKAEKLRRKPLSKLTDAELKERIQRLQLEKNAADLMRSTDGVDSKHISAGKKFIQEAGKQVVGPALVSAGKEVLTKYLKNSLSKKLGVDVADSMDELAKEAKKWGYEKTIYEGKSAKKRFEDSNNSSNDSRTSDNKNAEGGKKDSEDRTVYEGTVSGTGTSRSKKKNKNKNKNKQTTVYTDFVDVSYSRATSSPHYRLGNNVLSGLLEEPKK